MSSMMTGNYGEPYFGVNRDGHLCVKTSGAETKPGQEIDVLSVIEKANASTTADSNKNKVQSPMILRFPEVLNHRLDSLHAAFDNAMENASYGEAKYQGVFPVKASEDKDVVHDLLAFGQDRSFGLQTSSKQELELAMSCLANANAKPDAYLLCTGHKDAAYIALALSARVNKRLNVIVVMEAEEELDIVVEQSGRLGVEPIIGVRAKLHTRIPADFGNTAKNYRHGMVGLPAEKIYAVAEKLQDMEKLHWLKLLHFHIGSMIPTTQILHDAVSEAGDIYCTLVNRYGAEMTTLDCGGGFAIDYGEPRPGRSGMSAVQYGLEEYALTVVQAAKLKCEDWGVPYPILCTENGRGIVAHRSMVVLNPFSQNSEHQIQHHTHEQMPSKSDFHQHHSSKARPHAFSVDPTATGMFSHDVQHHKRVADDDNTEYNSGIDFSVFSTVPDFFSLQAMFPMAPVSQPSPDGKKAIDDSSHHSSYDMNLSVFSLTPNHFLLSALFPPASQQDSKIDRKPREFIENRETQQADKYVAVLMSGADQDALSRNQGQFGGLKTVCVSTTVDGDFEIVSGDKGRTKDEIKEGTLTYKEISDGSED